MKILLVAPHPFYQKRGTPIAVDLLLRSLSKLRHQVDLLTFHEGEEVFYEGIEIHRIKPWGKVQGIRPGFTFKKLYCDVFLFFKMIKMMFSKNYDVVHAVEESSFFAMLLYPFFLIPYIYDMDSLLSDQIVNKFKFLKNIEFILRLFESMPIRFARVVVPVCKALEENARKLGAKKILLLPDISLRDVFIGEQEKENIRDKYQLKVQIIMYIGNLEKYQGIDLLLSSLTLTKNKNFSLVIVGGVDEDINKYKAFSKELKIDDQIVFIGPRPIENLFMLMPQADLLLSPRIEGNNTPMKIYSYLDSGVPVLATDIYSHTQLLNDEIAYLVKPKADEFAKAIDKLLNDNEKQKNLAKNAKKFVEVGYTLGAYQKRIEDGMLYGHQM